MVDCGSVLAAGCWAAGGSEAWAGVPFEGRAVARGDATATAANDMTSRTSEVSTEAAGTGRHAADLRDNTLALNEAVEELRHSVIQVVRTSTAAVDRRQGPRYATDLLGRLAIAGQGEHTVQISDLSEGGVCLHEAPEMPVGAQGSLHIDGVAVALPCVMRAADSGGVHMEFGRDAAAALLPLLEKLRTRAAA